MHLTVSDLAHSQEYYERAIGLRVHDRENGIARLGTGAEDLLVLYEQPGAEPAARHTGLFHFALLLPARADLARWLVHATQDQIPLEGMSEHLVSEALYLRDPDWHGIEIYRDRPRSEWERDGDGVRMATLPLDVEDLIASLEGTEPRFEGLPRDTTMGHVHLQVADVGASEAFYADVMGFDIKARYGDQATFLSAGGYHHHVGANTWNSRGASPPPQNAAALRQAAVILPDDSERQRVAGRVAASGQDPEPAADGGILVRDPSQNTLLLEVARR